MAAKLDSLGIARVFRHPRTGELVVDTDSLRRPSRFSGFGFGADRYDDDDDDDDWDDDDEYDDGGLDDYDNEFEGDELGDLEGDELGDFDGDIEGDDIGDELGDDFGAEGRRRRRHLRRKLSRLNRREARTKRKLRRNRRKHGIRRKNVTWGMTAVSGTDTLTIAGAASVKIRLQHDFRATDITFTGSAPGAKVTSIFFGDRSVWSSSEGIDVTVFGATSFLRGLLKGQSLKAGLDITVNGTMTGTGDFAVAIIGTKPAQRHC